MMNAWLNIVHYYYNSEKQGCRDLMKNHFLTVLYKSPSHSLILNHIINSI